MKPRKVTVSEFARITNPTFGIVIIEAIAKSTKLTSSSKILFGRIMKIPKNEYPTRKELSEDLGWSIRKLDYNIKSLKKKNLLKTKQKTIKNKNVNTYTLDFEELLEEV